MTWQSSADWWAWYNAYLESDEWHQFRELALDYYGRMCHSCMRRARDLMPGEWLEIDHLHYRTVGHEAFEDVQVLCNTCHKKKTARTRRWRTVKKILGV